MKIPFCLVILPCLIGMIGSATAQPADKPNIVLILADDLGYADTGFTGSKEIRTPHLDRLAASGVIFTQGYANHPYCAPSRAGLLAGRYQQRFGFEANPHHDPANPYLGIGPEETLFPERLRKAGYVTGCIGKWHLGAGPEFHPNRRGFDYFYGFIEGGHDYFRIDMSRPDDAYLAPLARNDQPASFDGYLTDALSRDAVEFIRTNKDQPFFLFLSYNAPHSPLQAPKEDIELYKNIADPKRRVYAAMVHAMDRGIGEVIDALESNELRKGTMVFFLSDNGGPIGMPENKYWWNGSSNGPLREGKAFLYEGGIRVPFLASWPDRIPAGKSFDFPVISLDIARTAVEHAGADAQSDRPLEGVDLVPFVRGDKTDPPHEGVFFRDSNGKRFAVIRSDGRKLVQNHPGGKIELFDLSADLDESEDLFSKDGETAQALRSLYDDWNASNVPARFLNSPLYRKLLQEFYVDTIPEDARAAGFGPEK
ncbi:MAG: sulfatase [Verrucomicrobiota bacterium]